MLNRKEKTTDWRIVIVDILVKAPNQQRMRGVKGVIKQVKWRILMS